MSDGYKRIVDNRMRGYGETDTDKKTIRINKSLSKKKKGVYGIPTKDKSVINTIVHEEMHAKHPKMHEDTVRKKTRTFLDHLSRAGKQKLYQKYG